MMTRKIFYFLKPYISRRLQIYVRQQISLCKRSKYRDVWPIDRTANSMPERWVGWPNGKKFAFVLTHDVDTANGQEKCAPLMELENDFGFRSAFNFVPKRYDMCARTRRLLAKRGFEVGVHGLSHDGKLFQSKEIFSKRAKEINRYLNEWHAVGFRAPAMHHNLEWLHALNILYDASTFDTDPFEPQPDGVGTIFPFWVENTSKSQGYVELPYTLPQDFTLFVLLKERDIAIWHEKLDWIAENGGMALLNTHPDYMSFDNHEGLERYPAEYYAAYLSYVNTRYFGQFWHVLPKEVAVFFRAHMYTSAANYHL